VSAAVPKDRRAGQGVASPCVSVCVMDPVCGRCTGCCRTLDEIAAWSVLDDAAKRAVWAALPARRVKMNAGC
jgi:predicted Fe-S protein YdhL (DUF1289 family)